MSIIKKCYHYKNKNNELNHLYYYQLRRLRMIKILQINRFRELYLI